MPLKNEPYITIAKVEQCKVPLYDIFVNQNWIGSRRTIDMARAEAERWIKNFLSPSEPETQGPTAPTDKAKEMRGKTLKETFDAAEDSDFNPAI